MAAEGTPFTGFLYCGLMLTADGPEGHRVQLPLRRSRSAGRAAAARRAARRRCWRAAAAGAPLPATLRFSGDAAVGVVLASGGYPGPLDTGHVIDGLDRVRAECPDVALRFAGVSRRATARSSPAADAC